MALQLWDDFEEEFSIFGFSSKGLDEIKLIYSINHRFNLKFARIYNLDVKIDQEIYCYSLYSYDLEKDENPFYIVKNHSHTQQKQLQEGLLFDTLDSNRYILPRHKEHEYFLKIPYVLEEGEINPLPLQDALFITNYSLITNLSPKEKKLFSI